MRGSDLLTWLFCRRGWRSVNRQDTDTRRSSLAALPAFTLLTNIFKLYQHPRRSRLLNFFQQWVCHSLKRFKASLERKKCVRLEFAVFAMSPRLFRS